MSINGFIDWLARRQGIGYIDIKFKVSIRGSGSFDELHYTDSVENVLYRFQKYVNAFCVKNDYVKDVCATYIMFFKF